jgi:hypothetical protein
MWELTLPRVCARDGHNTHGYIFTPEDLPIALGALHEARSKALRAGVQVSECRSVPTRVMPCWRVPEKHAVIDASRNGFGNSVSNPPIAGIEILYELKNLILSNILANFIYNSGIVLIVKLQTAELTAITIHGLSKQYSQFSTHSVKFNPQRTYYS